MIHMTENDGFLQLLLLSFGVMTVFTIIANLTDPLGVPGPWEAVTVLIAPLILVICFMGFAAYVVTHR